MSTINCTWWFGLNYYVQNERQAEKNSFIAEWAKKYPPWQNDARREAAKPNIFGWLTPNSFGAVILSPPFKSSGALFFWLALQYFNNAYDMLKLACGGA